MARSLHSLLIAAFLLTLGICLPLNVQAPPKPTWVDIATDMSHYFIADKIQARMVIRYTGPTPPLAVRFDWFDSLGGNILNETKSLETYEVGGVQYAAAYSNWTSNMTGVNFKVRGTHIDSGMFNESLFNVSTYEESVRVDYLSMALTSSFYEKGSIAEAATTINYLGNGSLLEGVFFNWTYSNGSVAYAESVLPASSSMNGSATVTSHWEPDRVDNPYRVEAVYEGVQPLNVSAFFEVIPIRVNRWWNSSVLGSERWTAAESPYGVCDNITIPKGSSLVIDPGVTVRFCPDTGLYVRGRLVMQGSFGSDITLTAYAYPPKRGDWRGVEYQGSDEDVPIISHVYLNYSERGFLFSAMSQTLVNVTIANSSIGAIEAHHSEIWISETTITDSQLGVRAFQSTLHIFETRILRCMDAIIAEESNGTLEGNIIGYNTKSGVQVLQSSLLIRNNVISNNLDKGITLENSQDVRMEGNAISWSNFTIRSYNSTNLTLIGNAISNSEFSSLSLTLTDGVLVENTSISSHREGFRVVVSSLTVVNSTIQSQRESFRVEGPGSTITALNCSLDDSLVSVDAGSWLYINNFLHVYVATTDGSPIKGARVVVTVDRVPWPPMYTTSDGWIRWIIVRYESFDGLSSEPEISSVQLEVSLDGYNITDALRRVNMSASHIEVFQGYFLPIPRDESDQLLMILLIVLVAIVGVALALALILKRRKRGKEKPAVPQESPEPAMVELQEGKGYIFAGDCAERGFEAFLSQIEKGAKGLCFTRTYPPNLEERHSLTQAKIVWLSRNKQKGGLLPTHLGGIIKEVEEFLESNREKRTVILLDGLEYLIAQNSFGKALKLVHVLKDHVSVAKGILLVPFNLESVSGREAAMLTSDLEVIS